MIKNLWQQTTKRQRFLALAGAVVILVSYLAASDISTQNLPLPGNVRKEKQRLEQLKRDLKVLQAENQGWEQRRLKLQQLGKRCWRPSSKNAQTDIHPELEAAFREAQVNYTSLSPQQAKKISEKTDYLSTVEWSVTLAGTSMQDISRLLGVMDKKEPSFLWAVCPLRPEPLKEPRMVALENGRIVAVVLSPEAARILADDKEGKP